MSDWGGVLERLAWGSVSARGDSGEPHGTHTTMAPVHAFVPAVVVGCWAGQLDVPGHAGGVVGRGEVFVVDNRVVPPAEQRIVGQV